MHEGPAQLLLPLPVLDGHGLLRRLQHLLPLEQLPVPGLQQCSAALLLRPAVTVQQRQQRLLQPRLAQQLACEVQQRPQQCGPCPGRQHRRLDGPA